MTKFKYLKSGFFNYKCQTILVFNVHKKAFGHVPKKNNNNKCLWNSLVCKHKVMTIESKIPSQLKIILTLVATTVNSYIIKTTIFYSGILHLFWVMDLFTM